MNSFLKKLRQKNNVSQEFLAKQLGVSRPTYVQIENGSRKMRVDEAINTAKFFGLSLDDFLSGRENPLPKIELEKSEAKTSETKHTEMRISVPQENIPAVLEILKAHHTLCAVEIGRIIEKQERYISLS